MKNPKYIKNLEYCTECSYVFHTDSSVVHTLSHLLWCFLCMYICVCQFIVTYYFAEPFDSCKYGPMYIT